MALASLEDLFHNGLRDMYYAEKKLLSTLPKMAKASANEQLAEAFQNHRSETETQVERLEKVFEIIDQKPRGKKCPAMDGLVAEGSEMMKEAEEDAVKDAGLIAAGQAVEHYEIARYGTLIAWAKQMDQEEAAELLAESLEEEKAADELLNTIAEEVNEAAQSPAEEEEDED
jgi:ferritin-like metal-binding protein YciE